MEPEAQGAERVLHLFMYLCSAWFQKNMSHLTRTQKVQGNISKS